jgi:hypothetical protein
MDWSYIANISDEAVLQNDKEIVINPIVVHVIIRPPYGK